MGAPDPAENSPGSDPEVVTPPPVDPEEAESGLPKWRRMIILFVVSWNCHVIVWTSTSVLVASPEISEEFTHATPTIINITNAAVLLAMGISSMIWVPLSDRFSRRIAYISALAVMFITSIGTAVAPNMATFTAMRLLGTGFTGTYFMVAGQTIIADIFGPLMRGRAIGLMMVGSVAGGAMGTAFPLIKSIKTHSSFGTSVPVIANFGRRSMLRRHHHNIQPLAIDILAPSRAVGTRIPLGTLFRPRHSLQREPAEVQPPEGFQGPHTATNPPRRHHLWFLGFNAVRAPVLRETHHQPSLQPHYAPSRRPVLLCSRRRVRCWKPCRRPLFRPHCQTLHREAERRAPSEGQAE